MAKTAPDLQLIAVDMGVRLCRHDGGLKGFWHPATRTISTRRGVSIRQYRSTLAHELAHAYYGDPGGHIARHELRADRWAANLLIDRVDCIDAATWYNHHFTAIADELEVTHHILRTWMDQHDRIGA